MQDTTDAPPIALAAVPLAGAPATPSSPAVLRAPSLCLALLASAIASCAGSVPYTAAPPGVAVGVTPATAQVVSNGQATFVAAVTGSANNAVTWSVTQGGGTIDTRGLYTAPASPGSSVVEARSVADPSKAGTAQ